MRMELHVHCHISGGHVLLNFIAQFRFWIFRKELPVVLEAFRHGDRVLFEKFPGTQPTLLLDMLFMEFFTLFLHSRENKLAYAADNRGEVMPVPLSRKL